MTAPVAPSAVTPTPPTPPMSRIPLMPPVAPRPATSFSTREVIGLFARLRWRLLRGAIRQGGAQGVGVIIGLIASVAAGTIGSVALAVAARAISEPETLLVIFPVALVITVLALGVIAGVTQPVDPRILSTEPLTDRQLTTGLLTASAFGPPGITAALLGLGLLVGSVDSIVGLFVGLVALAGFLTTMLLISRTTVNLLGLATNRFPRFAQLAIGLVSLGFYGSFQFIPRIFGGLDPSERRGVADVARFTPPGQIGQAFADANDAPLTALGHAALGSLWLPVLAWILVRTTRRLLLTSGMARGGGSATSTTGPVARLARLACGSGAVGAIAWRSVRTRMRHPKSALETFVGAGIGLAVVLVPALTRDEVGASAVLVGGATQLSVLFMAGNAIGADGPALGAEILCGLEPEVIIEAKVRSVLVVASPLAVIGPLLAAAITGEWAYLPAGVAVGVAGLLAGAGGSITQSAYVPVAIPESDNPLASGDSGSGLLAGLVLVVVLFVLAVLTLPVALALVWALTTGSVALVTVFAAATVGAGWLAMRVGRGVAARRWRGREAEIYEAIIPST